MTYLSDELLITIFVKIKNQLDFLRCREVCKKWNIIINYLSMENKLWHKLCFMNDIQPWIYKLVEKKIPLLLTNELGSLTQLNWKQIYLSYRLWQSCHEFSSNKVRFDLGSSKITSMDVRGSILAIGHQYGIVRYFLIEKVIQQLNVEHYSHYCITRIKLWLTDTRKLIAVISLEDRFLEFWDIVERKSIHSIFLEYSTSAITCNGNRLFIANKQEIIECMLDVDKISVVRANTFVSLSPMPSLLELDIIDMNDDQNNKLTLVRCNNHIVSTSTFLPMENLNFILLSNGFMKNYQISPNEGQKFIFHYAVPDVFLIANDLYLYICLKKPSNVYEWRTYVLSPLLKSNISSIFMHSNVLLIGAKSGFIHMYVLKNIEQLLVFTSKPMFTRKFQICTQPISNLNVAQFDNILYIFATAGKKLYTVTLLQI